MAIPRHVNRRDVEITLSQVAGLKRRDRNEVRGTSMRSWPPLERRCARGGTFSAVAGRFLTVQDHPRRSGDDLVGDFKDVDKIKASNLDELAAGAQDRLRRWPARSPAPEQRTKAIFATVYGEKTLNFSRVMPTARPGTGEDSFEIANCRWMQILTTAAGATLAAACRAPPRTS